MKTNILAGVMVGAIVFIVVIVIFLLLHFILTPFYAYVCGCFGVPMFDIWVEIGLYIFITILKAPTSYEVKK